MNHSQIAIFGAGPIGLEAALACIENNLEFSIYEKGAIAENIRRWEHVRLFSPFLMNRSQRGKTFLGNAGLVVPDDDSILTGKEFQEQYLKPISELAPVKKTLRENTDVLKVSRNQQLKSDHVGSEARANAPFRILVSTHKGEEYTTADTIIDCTGTFGNHNWVGSGGIPAIGEKKTASQICYTLPDISGKDRKKYEGATTLVIGGGYSAATNVVALASLKESTPRTEIIWLTRNFGATPISQIPDDPLPERMQLITQANSLATSEHAVKWISHSAVESIHSSPDTEQLEVLLTHIGHKTQQKILVDQILANVGFRPDRSIYEELQIHECYATHGPMKLAASLMKESSADCLDQQSQGISTLFNPEPNYFILGSKSYGRNSRFLLKIGIDQVEEVIQHLSSKD